MNTPEDSLLVSGKEEQKQPSDSSPLAVGGEADLPADVAELMEQLCSGYWRLKPQVVLRVEEDGAILFDPESNGTLVINVTGSALLRWRPERVCYDEWCEALCAHYTDVEPSRVQNDMRAFLTGISFLLEKCNGGTT